jgi:hypothetical protein
MNELALTEKSASSVQRYYRRKQKEIGAFLLNDYARVEHDCVVEERGRLTYVNQDSYSCYFSS